MSAGTTGRLVILSGPSCVGKSPLRRALATFYPQIWNRLRKLVLFNSRAPRPENATARTTVFGREIRLKR